MNTTYQNPTSVAVEVSLEDAIEAIKMKLDLVARASQDNHDLQDLAEKFRCISSNINWSEDRNIIKTKILI